MVLTMSEGLEARFEGIEGKICRGVDVDEQ